MQESPDSLKYKYVVTIKLWQRYKYQIVLSKLKENFDIKNVTTEWDWKKPFHIKKTIHFIIPLNTTAVNILNIADNIHTHNKQEIHKEQLYD